MANKTALGVLGVIVLVSMGVGILIGMQLGGSETALNPQPNDPGTATPVPTSGPATPSSDDQSGSSDGETTVAPRRFDRSEIEAKAKELINDRRTDAGPRQFQVEGNVVDRLTNMARRHSVGMANEGELSHNINGTDSADRYREADLYDACQFEAEGGGYVVRADIPENNALEVLGQTVAGRPYEKYGETRFNGNETAVARALVDSIWARPRFRDRLLYDNAESLAIGVEITRDGTVYATGNVC